MTTCTQIEYAGWNQVHLISNGHLELVVVSEIGPRIMSLALPGRHNMFRTLAGDLGQRGGTEFRLYGGQRLWAAPENAHDTYYPDNSPAEFRQVGPNRFRVTAPVEQGTGLQKEMQLQMAESQASVRVSHRIINRGPAARTFAPWALSVMNLHGTAIVPMPPYGAHGENLAPVSMMSLWAYTDLSDPRWSLGNRYLLLRQDALAGSPQKIGLKVSQGWAAYVLDNVLFVKTYDDEPNALYPDFGSNTEIYTDHRILEVESLGPLATVSPDECVMHTETWHLVPDVPVPATEQEVEDWVMPHIARIRQSL